jgi:hypothetical protein
MLKIGNMDKGVAMMARKLKFILQCFFFFFYQQMQMSFESLNLNLSKSS